MGKKQEPYAEEVGLAITICAKLGLTVERVSHPYEIATIKGDGVSLLLYPHKTRTTGNDSVRLRDNGSKNKARAREVMLAMKRGDGLPEDIRWRVSTFNTFYAKTLPEARP